MIPIEQSEILLKLTNGAAKLLVIAGAGHNDIHLFKSYIDGLTAELPGL